MTVRGIVLSLIAILTGCATLRHPVQSSTLAGTEPIPKLIMIDERLYRGGQPTPDGFRQLAQMGIRTVIDLRAENRSDQLTEQRLVESLGMRWVHLPMRSYWRPSDVQVGTFLSDVTAEGVGPVFIHCRKGEDRTGVLVAIYRIVHDGWAPRQAYAEARALGLAGWNPFMRYQILHAAKRRYAPFGGACGLIESTTTK